MQTRYQDFQDLDTDIVAREVVEPGEAALEEIRTTFGNGVLDDDGRLDRKAMRDIVFADNDKLNRLEAILHPKIRDRSFEQAREADGPYVIIVVPLLYESPMRESMDRVLVVDCHEETQLERLMARDNESAEQGRRIMATQASREDRLSIADDVIDNNGSLQWTREQVAKLHDGYVQMAIESR